MPTGVHEIFIKPDMEALAKKFTVAQKEQAELSLEDVFLEDIPCVEQILMSLPTLTPEKIIQLQKLSILQKHYHWHALQPTWEFFTNAMGI